MRTHKNASTKNHVLHVLCVLIKTLPQRTTFCSAKTRAAKCEPLLRVFITRIYKVIFLKRFYNTDILPVKEK